MSQPVATLPIKSDSRVLMGDILLERGKLRQEDIEFILQAQKKQGTSFGETAKSLGLVTDKDVEKALALQFGYHYVEPQEAGFSHELFAAYEPFSPQVEMLRSVRTHLLQHWFDRENAALTMLSATAREGTSFFAANLAVVFSQLGMRTLLIDANLRQPRQHRIFNLGSPLGLSDILANRAGAETFSKIETFPSLSVLPAGTIPPNPLELLCRSTFAELIHGLSGRFSIILIDAPAFTRGTDALAISAHTRGAMLVCRKGYARVDAISSARHQLHEAGIKMVGSALLDF